MKYYYKVLKDDYMTRRSKEPYHLGLNVDPLPFNDDPTFIGPGGIYFSDREHIKDFLDYGTKICKIRIPKGEKVVEIFKNGTPLYDENKFKAHSIFIEEIHDMTTIDGIEWMKKRRIPFDWADISFMNLNLETIRKYKNKIDWSIFSYNLTYNYPEDIVSEFKDKIDWKGINYNFNDNEKRIRFLRRFKDYLDWGWISCSISVTNELDIIEEFKDYLNWNKISVRGMSDEFIRKYKDYVDWTIYSMYVKDLSDEIVDEFADKLNWDWVSHSKLSHYILEKYEDRINWNALSRVYRQTFTDEQLIKHKDEIDWRSVCVSQKLSENVMLECFDKISWVFASKYQKIPDSVLKKIYLNGGLRDDKFL